MVSQSSVLIGIAVGVCLWRVMGLGLGHLVCLDVAFLQY